MSDEEKVEQKESSGVGGFFAMLGLEIGRGLLQFLILGLILLVAVLLFMAVPWLGIAVGVIGFIVWTVKTGWRFF